jgi:F-type H+-transporting ATPase subunit b
LRPALGAAAALAISFAWAAPALAAEAGHAPDTWLGIPRTAILVGNLVIFLGGLAYVATPLLRKFLTAQQDEVRKALATAEQQRQEAARMETRLQAQIAELRREVDEVAERAKREGERERQEILRDAERDRTRLAQQAKNEIEQGLGNAKKELTAHAARLAAGLAGERLESGLTADDRKRLFRDNLARLERHS